MHNILEKYSDITFTNKCDKSDFIDSLEKIYNTLTTQNNKVEFLDILESSLLEYTKFDNTILYNPFELFDALIEKDLLWEKFDDDEIQNTVESLNILQRYINKKIDEITYLEAKYNIKIILEKNNVCSPQSGIYWAWLWKIWSASIVHKLSKLLDDYPIIFIKNIKLHKIVIVSYFFKIDQYWNKTQLWGFETLGDNNIYLSYRNLIDSFDHELYHQAMQYYNDSTEWENLRENTDLFYTYKNINNVSLGFARNYWKENIAEDQATIAEGLFLNYQNLTNRSEKDKILARKIELVKNAYFDLSDWLIDKNFWIKRNK